MKGTKSLAMRYRMDPAALDARLERARDEYLRNKEQKVPTREEVKLILGPIARQAEELHNRLRDLHPKPEDNKPFHMVIQQRLDYWPEEHYDLSAIDKRLGTLFIEGEGRDSLLGNLSIELTYLHMKAHEVMDGWDKGRMKDTARNMVILRVAQAWKQLTNKPATYSSPKNKNTGEDPDNPPPKYYSGKRYGPFLDFLTAACDLIGVEKKEGELYTADAIVSHFVKLKGKHKGLL
jgi:hypothetical protein